MPEPGAGRLRPLRLVAAWLASALPCSSPPGRPGAEIRGFGGARRRGDHRRAQRHPPPVVAALRLPSRSLGVPARARARRRHAADRRRPRPGAPARRRLRLGSRRRADRLRCEHVHRRRDRDRRRRRLHAAGRAAGRAALGPPTATDAPASCSSRSTGWRCRCCAARSATAPLPTWRAGWRTGATGSRVGDGPVLADRREPGRHPARRQRRHPGVPLGGQGNRDGGRLLEPGRLRRARAGAHAPAAGCWPRGVQAGATCCRAMPTRRCSRSAGWPRRSARTPATARSSRTGPTSAARSCSCCGRSGSS